MQTLCDINVWLFLVSFEEFNEYVMPLYNEERIKNGKPTLNEDETINLFLELRKEYDGRY